MGDIRTHTNAHGESYRIDSTPTSITALDSTVRMQCHSHTQPASPRVCVRMWVGMRERRTKAAEKLGQLGSVARRTAVRVCVGGWVGWEGGMQWAACVSTSARGKGGQHGRYHRTFACAFAPLAILDVQRECLGGLCLF